MFEKITHVAEQVAVNASRREFLGRLGRAALGVAAAAAGLLALPGSAEAGPKYCGTGSDLWCSGKTVGAPCGPDGTGICKGYGKTACYCRGG